MYSKKSKNFFILTLFIKVAFLVGLIIGVPYFLVSISSKYQKKAEGILEQENAAIEIQNEASKELKVLTQIEASTLTRISDFIGGIWISELDGRYRIQIQPNNKFEEYYDDVKEGFGVWRVFSGMKDEVVLSDTPEIADTSDGSLLFDDSSLSSVETSVQSNAPSAYTKTQFDSSAEKESKYFFQKQQYEPGHKGEKYVYQIQQLDTDKFILVYKGGTGRSLVFVRATSSPDSY